MGREISVPTLQLYFVLRTTTRVVASKPNHQLRKFYLVASDRNIMPVSDTPVLNSQRPNHSKIAVSSFAPTIPPDRAVRLPQFLHYERAKNSQALTRDLNLALPAKYR